MPRFALVSSVSLLAMLCVAPMQAQYRRRSSPKPPVSIGVYGELGPATSAQPQGRQTGIAGIAGVYGEYARHAFRPGLDARVGAHLNGFPQFSLWGNTSGNGCGSEKLIGPRLSYAHSLFHLYVEGLFGKADDDIVQRKVPFDYIPPVNQEGLMKLAVIGLDLDADTHVQVRVFEYSVGSLGVGNGITQQRFTTGLVFRFP